MTRRRMIMRDLARFKKSVCSNTAMVFGGIGSRVPDKLQRSKSLSRHPLIDGPVTAEESWTAPRCI